PTGSGRSARRETPCPVGALTARKQLLPSECPEAEAGQIQASGEEDQEDARAVQGPARVGQVPSDEHALPHLAKRDPESTENPQTMRAKVDAAPQSCGSAHTVLWTGCDRFDHGPPS